MYTFKLTRLLMVISIGILITFYLVLNNQVLKQPYRRYKKSSEIISLYKNNHNIIFYRNISNTIYPTSNDVRNNSKSTKLILVWTPFFGDREWGVSFKKCAIRDCVISSNSSLLLQSDAVLFHARDLLVTDLPRQRNPQQKWIFYSLESPHYSYFSGFGVLNGVFNWTMTYRLDSDVVVRYGNILPAVSRSGGGGITKELWKRKKRTVIWMVSHCETASKRETYADDLQKYIDVDIFGRCGNIVCPSDRTSDCLRSFSYMYKFYLSFENSICKDYVTEKLYTILEYDMIPVVLGGANYKNLAPPNSYIDALNFSSPKQLADYLYKVGNNYSLYKSYMDWKSTYRSNVDLNHCDLCAKLHTDMHTTSIKKDLKFWWVDEANCRNWKQ